MYEENAIPCKNKRDNDTPLVFISQAMSGLTEEEFKEQRNKCIIDIQKILSSHGKGIDKFNIIDNHTHDDAPKNVNRLWHLGRSIQQLGDADYIYFSTDDKSKKAKGCIIEHIIATLYEIPILKEETEREKLLKRWLY